MKSSFKIEKTISEEITVDLPAYREYAGDQCMIVSPHLYIKVGNFETTPDTSSPHYLRGAEIQIKQNYDSNISLIVEGKKSTEAAFNNAYQKALSFLNDSLRIKLADEFITKHDFNIGINRVIE